ncbi:MAG TPA: Rrf2 family transcriptional regulator [Bacteroidota bacterium]|nr:Rrf2 family transcriptional regulator [Bacteroidota bacterium]
MQPNSRMHTTKEIAEKYQISYQLLAKVMQRMAKKGYVVAHHGVNGGYTIARDANTLTISSIIQAVEGKPNVTIIQCEAETPENCIIHGTCTIKNPLVKLQDNINKVFDQLTIMEMV